MLARQGSVVRVIILINIVAFAVLAWYPDYLLNWLALWPIRTLDIVVTTQNNGFNRTFLPWQLISYGFLHAGLTHLILNMFGLSMLGRPLAIVWGGRRFVIYYLLCIVGAAGAQLVVTGPWFGQTQTYPTVGASGGIFGILLAFGMTFPQQRIMLLFPPIPIKARNFVIVYGLVELVFGVTGTFEGVAHFAHLGGMLAGYLLLRRGWPAAPSSP